MLVNHIAVNDRNTMEKQKNVLLLGLKCVNGWNEETTAEILSRLNTIQELEEVENEKNGFCSIKRPPFGIVYAELLRLKDQYNQSTDAEKKRLLKTIEVLKRSLKVDFKAILGFTTQVQEALINV